MRQEKTTAAKVAATAAKVSAATAATACSLAATPVTSAIAYAIATAPSSSSQLSPPTPTPASPSLSSVCFTDALRVLKSAVCDTAAAAIGYYDDIEFAARVCDDAAVQHGTNYDMSVPLQEACISLQRIAASKPPSTPSRITVISALADAESILRADPGLKTARQKIEDACDQEEQRLRDDVSQAELECHDIIKKLQDDEGEAHSSAANNIRLLEQQLGADASQIDRIKDEESRALAAKDFKSAQAANARAKAYIAECSQRVQVATSKRNLELEQQLLQLRALARDASAAGERAVADKRVITEAAVSGHTNHLRDFDASRACFDDLIARARELLGRQPAWPQHEALLCFDLHLQRLTTHNLFFKKWFPRFFCMRNRRLYYSDGENNRHPNTQDGVLAFAQSNPEPDGRYCVDLQGMHALPVHFVLHLW
jgi:hypothetical protein